MKFERFVKELIQGGWSLIGDSEGGISFLNTESEIEVEMENTKKESHVYLRFSHGLRMKDLSDLVEVGFTNTSTILKFADGENTRMIAMTRSCLLTKRAFLILRMIPKERKSSMSVI